MGRRLDIAQCAPAAEKADSTQVVLEKLPRDILLTFNLDLPTPAPETVHGHLVDPERIAPDARNRACRRKLVNGVTISVVNVEKVALDSIATAGTMGRMQHAVARAG